MKEKEKKKQIIKISVWITSIFVIFLSLTYAFINVQLKGEKKQVLNAGQLSLELLEDENNLTIENALPMYDEVGMLQEAFTFRLVNNQKDAVNYIIKLIDITTKEKLDTSIVKYGLLKDKIQKIDLLSSLENNSLDKGTILGNQTIHYSLRLWIDETVEDESLIKNKSLSYKISVEVNQNKEDFFILLESDELQDGTITVPRDEMKNITIKMTSQSAIPAKYELYYLADKLTDLEVGYYENTKDPVTGIIKPNEEKTISIVIENNSASDKIITFKVACGVEKEELQLSEGNKIPLETSSKYQSLYRMISSQSIPDNKQSEFVTNSSGINFQTISSSENGQGIYELTSAKGLERPIYYYRGNVSNNNVKFANLCWKIVRTTETGGVKLIYNGAVDSGGSCTNKTGTNTQLQTGAYGYGSMLSGYMYPANIKNSGYDYSERIVTLFDNKYFNYTIYYGTGITYDGTNYHLVNPRLYTNSPEVVGKYTFNSSDINVTNNNVYYIAEYQGGNLAVRLLRRGEDVNQMETIVYANSIKDNGDNTYTLVNPISFKTMNWKNRINLVDKYICANTTCSSAFKITGLGTYSYSYQDVTNRVYGKSFEYKDGIYTLKDTKQISNWKENYNSLGEYRYTCHNSTGTCKYIDYIYQINSNKLSSFRFEDGMDIETAIQKIDDNEVDSDIKRKIDKWYSENMTDYTSYLEDTIWCSDRSLQSETKDQLPIRNLDNPIYYSANGRGNTPNLSCKNKNDAFSINSDTGNGKLQYPVALLTTDEIILAGATHNTANTSHYLYTGQNWWTMTPNSLNNTGTYEYQLFSTGLLNTATIPNTSGIRPSISLKKGIKIETGNGTETNPFTIHLK